MLSKAPVSFNSGIHSLSAMSIVEAELVASALTMKEAVFCSNVVRDLVFGQKFGQVPLCIMSLGNQAFSSRTKHIALRYTSTSESC